MPKSNIFGGDGNDTIAGGSNNDQLFGDAGNDTLLGKGGNDVLIGGDGNDSIDGGLGNDIAVMGAGDDTFVWNPGDGSDTVDGQTGRDTLIFNGSSASEQFSISARGPDVGVSRDVGNVAMDLSGVDVVDVNALGGADTITALDTTGTDLAQLNSRSSSGNPARGGRRRFSDRHGHRQRHERRRPGPT